MCQVPQNVYLNILFLNVVGKKLQRSQLNITTLGPHGSVHDKRKTNVIEDTMAQIAPLAYAISAARTILSSLL